MPEPDLFNARRLSARIDIEQVAKLLGFHPDSIDHLVAIHMLNILAGHSPRTQRMFASAYILQLCSDVEWLEKPTKKIPQLHARKNVAQKETRRQRTAISDKRQDREGPTQT